ncbi:MAG TPA: hypothetical protein VLE22_05390, partial [Bryobacteraceae bacterium]|nr:hypothetical protein [Bryobacteraceae bacterium]
LWLTTIPWNLLWNLLARRYRPRPPLIRIVRTTVQVLVVGLLVHLAEVLAVLCRYVFRRSDPFRKTQQILYEYAQTPSPAGVPVLEGRAAEAAAASENGSAQRRTLAGKERSLRPPCLRLRRW